MDETPIDARWEKVPHEFSKSGNLHSSARQALRPAALNLNPKGDILKTLLPILLAALAFGFFTAPASALANQQQQATASKKGEHKVRPGNSHTNRDGVTVDNSAASGDYATINPKTGNELSETSVRLRSGFVGSVEGIDGNDTVVVRSNVTGTISGEGGRITMASGANVTVTNTAEAGGASITVVTSSGTVTLPPGSSATFS